ncbi:putative penicillin-binding protein PbpX [Staphylococcus arlettae]|nr:putative penicillin-binding protein PbpX [Staphylococcus arlettae]RBA01868.1 putative penicillin-binding protein PbpX [Staphylococcus arlettae]RBA06350.1 putative penicillin-binding protein PbpX [Staphylococcus arlettae]
MKTTVDTTNKVYPQINDYLESVNFNGTITIMQEGQLKLNKGYGMKNFETSQPNDANTMYLIGSSQKFLTGLMLKQLAIAKQINMEASLTQYIPWFQTIYPLNSNDLMLHQSGLFKYQPSEHVTSIQEATQAKQRRGINPNLYKKQ